MLPSVLLVGWGWTVAEYLDAAAEIESLGFHACYIGDDIFAHQANIDVGTFEPWTMLPAMAMRTRHLRLGSLVSPVGRRHPGLFAKITSTADLLSGGRMIVGMGAGNAPEQQRSLGVEFPSARERVAMLGEELEILRSLWTQTRTDFEGDHYSISGGVCEPKPPRPGGAEILLAAEKPKMVALAARFADRVNVLARGNSRTAEIARTTRRAADALGRRGDDLVISRMCTVLLTDDPIGTVDERYAAIDRRANQIGMEPSVLRHELDHWIHSYVGPLDGLRQWAHDSTDALGIDEMIICIDTIDTVDYQHTMAGLRLFSSAVINGR
ncbi:MAG: LLM class flavin-dependent oxidoreductase [Acidimicrobiaceae bacterium]|nr:LLM class flavin-dependent oxidoreductase [Acidimicrobiaceae bacterium]MCY3644845.1 LLM class flavin-dependent oxidoreductase [Acidimicrobiaceae bacterium]MDE0494906.1 LLM class flavin-dependent oxidoreductase [Acidimicrobiaceae bacterium]MYA15020.1 LLM class flavin-dependent oxidoreductase [Acidimicrobiaceae bacterium]MYE66244.1 LLM class flavin-dependent oxidoreductase [Acidimicrobiaceae bacterium]